MGGGTILHASAVAIAGRGVLILGPAGSGKSSLALDLMALGAGLVADDRTIVTALDGRLTAACPPAIRGLIEARGIGILQADPAEPVPVALVIDMAQTETARLPEPRQIVILDVALPVLHKVATPHFAAGIRQYMLCGRRSP